MNTGPRFPSVVWLQSHTLVGSNQLFPGDFKSYFAHPWTVFVCVCSHLHPHSLSSDTLLKRIPVVGGGVSGAPGLISEFIFIFFPPSSLYVQHHILTATRHIRATASHRPTPTVFPYFHGSPMVESFVVISPELLFVSSHHPCTEVVLPWSSWGLDFPILWGGVWSCLLSVAQRS